MNYLIVIIGISLLAYLYFGRWANLSGSRDFFCKPVWLRHLIGLTEFKIGKTLHNCKKGRGDRITFLRPAFYLGAIGLSYKSPCETSFATFTGLTFHLWPFNFFPWTVKPGDKFWKYKWELGIFQPMDSYCKSTKHIEE